MEGDHYTEQEINLEKISSYIKQLEDQRDALIKKEYYSKAKEFDCKIEECKAKENKLKTISVKRIHFSELVQLKDEFAFKHGALVKKWEAKVREMNSVIDDKINALKKKHNDEKEAYHEGHMSMNNTLSSSFYKSVRTSLNRPPATYLNIKKKQEMIFKGKNRDYTLAEQLKKESEKILKEANNKKLLRLKKDSQKEYYRLINRQEEEINKVQYEIKSNVDLMNAMREKEFGLLNQTFKNKTNYINRTQKIEMMFAKKIERYKYGKRYTH